MTARRLLPLLLLALCLSGVAAEAASAPQPKLLRFHRFGPLKLGMTRTAAVRTGWLAHRSKGCELAGSHRPVVYRVDGPRAPHGVKGTAEFDRGRLAVLSFTRGVRTAAGVVVHRTTAARMVRIYRRAGFAASQRFDSVFRGTFVTVKFHGKVVLGAFARHRVIGTLAVPFVPVCE